MSSYLDAVAARLGGLGRNDRRRVLDALAAQLDELREAGIDPTGALGSPEDYAVALTDALAAGDPADRPEWSVLGVPVETRGVRDPRVRSRMWDPTSPRVVVPRLFGIGWTLNLGALAVRLGLIRPDDATPDVLDLVPARSVEVARAVPLVVAGVTTGVLASTWRHLPDRVATGFGVLGRRNRTGGRTSLLAAAGTGVVPALWSLAGRGPTEDVLVRAAGATVLSLVSASAVAATVLEARDPGSRWGLLVPASLPLGIGASLAVIVIPLRQGLERSWRDGGIGA